MRSRIKRSDLEDRGGIPPAPVAAAQQAPALPSAAAAWFWGGLGFVVAAIALLELIDPFFFCQDDALALELPGVLQACRGLWDGSPATYNPFTFLGDPTHALGTMYPPLHASYALARLVLGDEHATFEVLAAIHLLAGYCLTFLAARRLAVGPPLAALAGATFVLSGPVLVMTRCWHSFGSTAAFIPLFALLVDRLRTGPVDWRWPIVTGLSLGIFYHAGFPQLFVLGCGLMLAHAFALAAFGLVPWRRLQWLLPALPFGAAISLPVFYQQWRLSREMTLNDPGGGDGIGGNILSMLLPYPLAQGTLPNDWGNVNLQWNGHFYYYGTVLLVAFLVAAMLPAWRRLNRQAPAGLATEPAGSTRLQLALAIPAVVAFLLALGESGGLWGLTGLLPVGLRNNPFRAMPWLVFFSCLAGARFLQDLLGTSRFLTGPFTASRRLRAELAIVGAGMALVTLHVTRVGIAFFVYGFTPYPRLPAELLAVIGPDASGRQQRIMTFAAMRSSDPSYPLALPHNLPCEYGVPAVFGYNPLVQRFGRYNACLERIGEQPQEALAAYGVRWLLVHRTFWGGWPPQTPNRFERVLPFLNLLVAVGKTTDTNRQVPLPDLDEYLKVIEIPDASPLAFVADRPADALPLRMSITGLDIDLVPATESRRVVANFLFYPDITATADGRSVAVSHDEWQRIVAEVPAGAATLRIRYRPPVAAGLVLAALSAAIGAGMLHWCRLRSAQA
jgi:hypothetical protein